MTNMKRNGQVILLSAAIGAATGVLLSLLRMPTAVGGALIGIVIGTGVVRGAFSRAPKGSKCN